MSGDYERQFANLLDEKEYHVIRAPSSGSATKRSLPDLAFSKESEETICVELKTTSRDIAYYTDQEVEALKEFAAAFHGVPRLAARFKGDTTFYTYRIKDARITDSGYAVDRDIEATKTYE